MRLRTRAEYKRMFQKSLKLTGQWILADIRLTQLPVSRLGITVTKRYGSACERNRFKRLVREAFRLNQQQFNLSFDLVIRPRTQAKHATLQNIQQELLLFIQHVPPAFHS